MGSLNEVYVIDLPYCWTDALDCIYWIKNKSKKWPNFVQRKVASIRSNVEEAKWLHCPSVYNPADIPSRGLDLRVPALKERWMCGPEFLTKSEVAWPKTNLGKNIGIFISHEVKENCLSTAGKVNDLNSIIDVKRYSNINKLLRVTSYVVRFTEYLKRKVTKSPIIHRTEVSTKELENAKKLWIINEQKLLLSDDKRRKELTCSLGIFSDEYDIYRLKGRLQNSDLNTDAKYPIYLDRKSYVTELIILDCHVKMKHCKVKDTLNELRATYWVAQGRRTINRVIKKCFTCNKFESKTFKSLPVAPLPEFRVKSDFPFTSLGSIIRDHLL